MTHRTMTFQRIFGPTFFIAIYFVCAMNFYTPTFIHIDGMLKTVKQRCIQSNDLFLLEVI